MKVGDTVKLKYQTKPGCLPEIATVLSEWYSGGQTGEVQYIYIYCPKLAGAFTVRADTYEVVRANNDGPVYNIPTTNQ